MLHPTTLEWSCDDLLPSFCFGSFTSQQLDEFGPFGGQSRFVTLLRLGFSPGSKLCGGGDPRHVNPMVVSFLMGGPAHGVFQCSAPIVSICFSRLRDSIWRFRL